jgi:hypothetical protein
LPRGLGDPPGSVAGDAKRPQGVIEKKQPVRKRKESAFGGRRHQETNGEIAELSGRSL